MKIGIIADTHGNVAGWDAAMDVALAGSDLIIHCGDVLHHRPKSEPTAAFHPQ